MSESVKEIVCRLCKMNVNLYDEFVATGDNEVAQLEVVTKSRISLETFFEIHSAIKQANSNPQLLNSFMAFQTQNVPSIHEHPFALSKFDFSGFNENNNEHTKVCKLCNEKCYNEAYKCLTCDFICCLKYYFKKTET